MRILRVGVAALATAVVVWVLGARFSVGGMHLPRLGPFLSPFTGFWVDGDRSDRIPASLRLPGLHGEVTVLWDDRRVPHVFASDDHDLYLAQGWLTARDRLFQMDFGTRAAEGRLSEIVGPVALEWDRFRRRIGIPIAAEAAIRALDGDPGTREALHAFAAGVNAWIDGLSVARLPLEYKILDMRPERWSPYRSAVLLKSMSWLLTGESRDLALTRARDALGGDVVRTLYPDEPRFYSPIVPRGTPFPFVPLPALPAPAGTEPAAVPRAAEPGEAAALGSNNWAVAAERSASGHALLSSDPHLPLTLPSVWHEIRLHGPDQDVYGVTLPGAPGVLIGFNDHVAWGETNAYSDVLDWYVVRFRDDTRQEYLLDGEWKPVTWRTETIRVRGGEDVVERIPIVHQGPVPYAAGERPFDPSVPAGAAMRWTGHDPSQEMRAFLALDRARGVDDVLAALRFFACPGQNFAFAADDGRVGIVHAGRFPVRRTDQGKFLLDGTASANDWAGFVPFEQLPQVIAPARGWVGSANQKPTDATYPYWLGWRYGLDRDLRIEERLDALPRATIENVMEMQNDTVSLHARRMLSVALGALDAAALEGDARRAYEALRGWNLRFDADAIAPTVFDAWQRAVSRAMWGKRLPEEAPSPGRDVTDDLVTHDPGSPWFDDPATPEREMRDDVLRSTFRAAVERLAAGHGSYGEGWRWGVVRRTRIAHVARIPGMGREVSASGQYGVLHVVTGSAGQSWRMVVELSRPPRAWAVYPGGQSGNPGSRFYDDRIPAWIEGRLDPVAHPAGPDSTSERVVARTVLEAAP